jgi:hypothetical protein
MSQEPDIASPDQNNRPSRFIAALSSTSMRNGVENRTWISPPNSVRSTIASHWSPPARITRNLGVTNRRLPRHVPRDQRPAAVVVVAAVCTSPLRCANFFKRSHRATEPAVHDQPGRSGRGFLRNFREYQAVPSLHSLRLRKHINTRKFCRPVGWSGRIETRQSHANIATARKELRMAFAVSHLSNSRGFLR